ncbi:hypothetical protein [Deinococcus arenicola]|uniref:Delta-60 repeat domain-containing protein n=1 Tax=Deinococcus arenicola TaxID=2994950 RepID=A0ABU4DL24_9DEIO|nr:hypothetical protein [Deinococcus sp. ZS9-10]MDV6373120.1 hypothetical protein [Deinococcus sp. ZS9-10]
MNKRRGWATVLLGLVLAGCGSTPVVAGPGAAASSQVAPASAGLESVGLESAESDLSAQALGASGALDPAYGQQGLASVPGGRYTQLVRALVQSDGQALMMGQSVSSGRVASHLVRVSATGQPDAAFNSADTSYFRGADAVPALLCPNGANRYNDWGAECQDPQRIVVASSDLDTGDLTLSRFLPSGQPDASFGSAGQVAAAVSVGDVSALLIQSDGAMVVLGSDGLARFRRGGALDRSFGTGGVAPLPNDGYVQDIVMDIAERFLVLVNTDDGVASAAQVVRLTSTGQPDPSYGADGRATLDFGPMGTGQKLLVLSTNRVMVGGSGGLWRLLPNGMPDSSFGKAGRATFKGTGQGADGSGFIISGLVEDNHKRLVASVQTDERFSPTFKGNLARFRPNGTLDPSFGSGGLSHVALCAACGSGLAEFNSVAVLKNGRLLGMGTSGTGTNLIAARMFP